MDPVSAMVLRIEEENKVYFYLPEEKKEIGFEVDESLIAAIFFDDPGILSQHALNDKSNGLQSSGSTFCLFYCR